LGANPPQRATDCTLSDLSIYLNPNRSNFTCALELIYAQLRPHCSLTSLEAPRLHKNKLKSICQLQVTSLARQTLTVPPTQTVPWVSTAALVGSVPHKPRQVSSAFPTTSVLTLQHAIGLRLRPMEGPACHTLVLCTESGLPTVPLTQLKRLARFASLGHELLATRQTWIHMGA
jgi:hypothetical protein